jgi:hypothetical protein
MRTLLLLLAGAWLALAPAPLPRRDDARRARAALAGDYTYCDSPRATLCLRGDGSYVVHAQGDPSEVMDRGRWLLAGASLRLLPENWKGLDWPLADLAGRRR